MLRIPSLYFNRVIRLFQDADVSRPEVERLVGRLQAGGPVPRDWHPPNVSPSLARFKQNWEDFVDTLVREWKTLNVVSALLLSYVFLLLHFRYTLLHFALSGLLPTPYYSNPYAATSLLSTTSLTLRLCWH